MSDGTIVTCTPIHVTSPAKLAEVQDHAKSRAAIGRAALGTRPVVLRETKTSDGRQVMEPDRILEGTQPEVSIVDESAPIVYTRQPVSQAAPPSKQVTQAGTQLATWALEQESPNADTPWDAIKVFLGEPPYASYKPKRQRIQMTGGGLGKVTLFVSTFSVSDTLLLIGFPLDGQTAIVEPPPADASDPILITNSGKQYRCISGGWSVEAQGQLLVALPLVPNETA